MDVSIENFDRKTGVDTDQIRTFLAVAANGSFLEAASRLHITQSTVSARIRNLEAYLGAKLFVRNRGGVVLTLAGRRFLRHAKSLIITIEQARYDLGLPSRFSGSITVGARIALCEGFIPRWTGLMREMAPHVSLRSEIGFEEELMRRLIKGTLDIGLMYTPQHSPGLQVEHLFDETLVLLSTDAGRPWPDDKYIYVDWGPEFYAQHNSSFPQLERPAQSANIGSLGVKLILANGGSCFLPIRMAEPLIKKGELHRVPNSPEFRLPAYMVFPRDSESNALQQALSVMRSVAAMEQNFDG
ncbi:MAG: LysR family transcriptional regulator [Thiohalomonadaceae bacterium]